MCRDFLGSQDKTVINSVQGDEQNVQVLHDKQVYFIQL